MGVGLLGVVTDPKEYGESVGCEWWNESQVDAGAIGAMVTIL